MSTLPVNSRKRKTRASAVRPAATGRQAVAMRQGAAGRQAATARPVVRRAPAAPMTVDLCSLPEEDPSCIDLTNEPDDIVDLTLLNDTPVVCLETVSLPVTPVRLPLGTPVNLPVSSSRRSNRKRSAQGVELSPSSRLQPPVLAPSPGAASSSKRLATSPGPASTSSKSSKSAAGDSKSSQPKKIDVSCPICFDTMKMIQASERQLVSTICGHIFCSTCLLAAIKSSHACPNCRKKLTVKQYHPIFI